MHQITQFHIEKQKSFTPWEVGNFPPTPSPLARYARSGSVASLTRIMTFSPLDIFPSWKNLVTPLHANNL